MYGIDCMLNKIKYLRIYGCWARADKQIDQTRSGTSQACRAHPFFTEIPVDPCCSSVG